MAVLYYTMFVHRNMAAIFINPLLHFDAETTRRSQVRVGYFSWYEDLRATVYDGTMHRPRVPWYDRLMYFLAFIALPGVFLGVLICKCIVKNNQITEDLELELRTLVTGKMCSSVERSLTYERVLALAFNVATVILCCGAYRFDARVFVRELTDPTTQSVFGGAMDVMALAVFHIMLHIVAHLPIWAPFPGRLPAWAEQDARAASFLTIFHGGLCGGYLFFKCMWLYYL